MSSWRPSGGKQSNKPRTQHNKPRRPLEGPTASPNNCANWAWSRRPDSPRPALSKLPQEAQVVRPELPNVVDGVPQHRDALRPHAEGEAAEARRVVAAVAQ